MSRAKYDAMTLMRLWYSDMKMDEIAEEMGLTKGQLQGAANRLRLGSRPPAGQERGKQPTDDPTPEEIAATCEEIRKRWSMEEEQRRRGGTGTWSVPSYA